MKMRQELSKKDQEKANISLSYRFAAIDQIRRIKLIFSPHDDNEPRRKNFKLLIR